MMSSEQVQIHLLGKAQEKSNWDQGLGQIEGPQPRESKRGFPWHSSRCTEVSAQEWKSGQTAVEGGEQRTANNQTYPKMPLIHSPDSRRRDIVPLDWKCVGKNKNSGLSLKSYLTVHKVVKCCIVMSSSGDLYKFS